MVAGLRQFARGGHLLRHRTCAGTAFATASQGFADPLTKYPISPWPLTDVGWADICFLMSRRRLHRFCGVRSYHWYWGFAEACLVVVRGALFASLRLLQVAGFFVAAAADVSVAQSHCVSLAIPQCQNRKNGFLSLSWCGTHPQIAFHMHILKTKDLQHEQLGRR